MAHNIMKKFTTPGLHRLIGKTGFLTLGLMVLLGLTGNSAKAQDSFSSPQVLSGDFGSVAVDNTGVTPDQGAPTIAGLPPQHTLWFQWSTTNSGEVEIDTINSADDVLGVTNLDTVLGVYTGTGLATLNLVSANDNLYPDVQENEAVQNTYSFGSTNNFANTTNAPYAEFSTETSLGVIVQPFAGPSGLRFNAVAGTTYYFAVDTRGQQGLISLNWSLHPSGVFRFATENSDLTGLKYADGRTPVLLYETAETESSGYTTTSTDPVRYTLFNDANGVLLTVTRVAGSYGRVSVNYATTNLIGYTNLMATNGSGFLANGDLTAVAGIDYVPVVSGTLTFDDYEMSKTILIPIIRGVNSRPALPPRPNRDFGVLLSTPQVDPSESPAIPNPRVDNTFDLAVVRILDVNTDPTFGPVGTQVVTTNPMTMIPVTNIVYTTTATNSIFNFEKRNYRVYRAGSNSVFTIYVDRDGTNTAGASIHWAVNSQYPVVKNSVLNDNYLFPLTPGSDYATPDPQNSGNVFGRVPDFIFPGGYSGTLTWAANDFLPKPITFTVYNNNLQRFNEDFEVELYNLDTSGNPYQVGMVKDTTVTILNANDVDNNNGVSNILPPAGAVDELYNADYGSQFFLNTVPPQMAHPGTDGEVSGLALQPDGNLIVVGNFFSYDQTSRNSIARVTSSGYLDPSFNPGQGADDFISCVALTTNSEVLIGGNFTSYNGEFRSGIALVTANGSLDTTFNPGNGFNGTVSCLLMLTNGQALVGGDFTSYNGQTANHIARLNMDGTLDTTFNPGTTLNGSVDAIALQSNGQIVLGGDFTTVGAVAGQNYLARLNANGSLDTSFDPGTGPNGSVFAVAVQPDGNILVGGAFTQVNGQNLNNLARLTGATGGLDANFFGGIGVDGPVYNLNVQTNTVFATAGTNGVVQTNFTIYVGGQFTEYNGTHRLGFARLNSDGTIDTSFLDTAYNQFAGLTREYYGDSVGSVLASVVQPNGDVLIGGSFDEVGGGEFNASERPDDYSGVFTSEITRSGTRNHSNLARLHGGASEGPGNIGLDFPSYSINKSAGSLFVGLVRTNGFLGPAAADFSVIPGLAQNGVDYIYDGNYNGSSPLYWILWENAGPTRMHSDGFFGQNDVPTDAVIGDSWSGATTAQINLDLTGRETSSSDLSASFQLSNPADDQFYLGGEDIPLGVGLGASAAPLTLIADQHASGTFGFSSPSYTGTGNAAPITIVRTNGSYGVVTVSYATSTNGSTAVAGADYRAISGGLLSFAATDVNKSFNVTILSSNYVSTVEKTVNLLITALNPPVNGIANLGLSNAVLRIINPNFQGYLNLSSNAYGANLSAGSVTITVTRTVGSLGTLNVICATTNGTAVSGTDFTGFTNLLSWNNGDVTPRVITVPLLNNHSIGANKQFGINLYDPTNNTVSTPALFAVNGTSNAVVTITNNNSDGTFQFSAPSYVVNENGGYSTITVTRTGSTNGTASVQFATANGSAVSGPNYVSTNGTLSFVPGQLAADIYVPVKDDGIVDPVPFFFTISLSSPSAGSSLGSPIGATNYIVDAESFNRPPGNGDTTFNPGTGMNGDVNALALQSTGKIIAGGNFTTVNGVPENYVARLNTDGSLDTTGFLNGLAGGNGTVYSVVDQTDDQILVGGAFTSFDGTVRNRITRLNTDGSVDTSFNPGAGADNIVYSLAETFIGGTRAIYAGGAFSTMNGVSHPNLVRLTEAGAVDANFAPSSGPNGTVYAVAAYSTNSVFAGKLLVGGTFTAINNFPVAYIARMNADGSVDTNFDLSLTANAAVRAIAIQNDDRIVIGGDFTNVDNVPSSHLARLNSDGSLDTSFTASCNGTVNAIALQADDRIVIGGQFSQAGGVTRNSITRLLPTGVVDPTIDFGDGANGAVDAVVIQPANQMMVIGGGFTQYNDQPAGHVERIYGGSITGVGAFEFTSGAYQVDEDGAQALISIRRTGGTSGPNPDGSGSVNVTFSTTGGTAVPGVNYDTVNQTVSFPPGEVLETIPVPVIDDSNITANLTVNLTLSSPTPPAVLGNQPTSVLTIINDDSAVNFTSSSYVVAKNNLTGFGTMDVERIGTTNGTCTVNYYTATNGTAVAGTDFYPTNGTLTFSPGQTDQIIYVPIINNGLVEGNRTVVVALTNNVGTLLFAPSNSVLTIDDTVAAPGQLFFSTTNYVAGSGDGSAFLTVLRTNGSSGSVTVTYTTVPGTAQPGVNYNSVTSSITFNDGDTTKTFGIPVINNPQPQGPVSLSVFLSNPTGGASLSLPTNATVTIVNTNAGIAFALVTNTVFETAGTVDLYVDRFGASNGTTTVSYYTTNGTAIAGSNYVATSGTLTFFPGETLKPIPVSLIYNPLVTEDLTFGVVLFNASSPARVVNPSETTVLEQSVNAGLSFATTNTTVFKNAGSVTIAVVCSTPDIEPVITSTNQVPLQVGFYSVNGTAIAGQDYQAVSGTLVFTNGIVTNYFTVPILNNGLISGNKTFSLVLTNPTAPGELAAPSIEPVVIAESNAGLEFSQNQYSVFKNGGSITIDVLRTGYTNSNVSVNFVATNGTAVNGQNYDAVGGTLLFTNGQTQQSFNIPILANNLVQPNLTVLLQLSDATNGYIIPPGAATLNILENGGSYIIPAGAQMLNDYTSAANAANNVIGSNDTVRVLFAFRDSAGLNATNLIAYLLATNGVVAPSPASQDYGPLTVYGHSVSEPFTFTAHGTNTFEIAPTFSLYDNSKYIGTASFGLTIGTWTTTFYNSNAITITANSAASPYPSVINVSGVGGTLLHSAVTVSNLFGNSPASIDALVVAPAGGNTLLMAHAGGQNTIAGVTLTFDDGATNSLSQTARLTTSTNKPTQFYPVGNFP